MQALSQKEIEDRLKTLPNWKWEDQALVRIETFPTYLGALDFVQKLGQMAEKEDHHPDIIMNYKKVTVKFWTHSANGLTNLDFRLAQMTDKLLIDPKN